ncbi:hypothetical protein L3X38_035801 [Prunus dulcis]|uniref:Uncharacterized protein n=1 Tax=Prunus dulcis TaxID=3755 RepID=A0AAD4VM84_PRUDU|nr:hypothetical protein L3X38_035801 [Prunus dulcis]
MHVKDPDCCECYCGWCGQSKDLTRMLQLEKATGSGDMVVSSSDSDSDNSDAELDVAISSKRKRKKRIRRIIVLVFNKLLIKMEENEYIEEESEGNNNAL